MDARAVTAELQTRLAELGIGHTVEFVSGSNADGVMVRSPYAEPVTVVEDANRFQLVTRGADGGAKLVDTELSVSDPVALLALYLAFHSLWAMKRTVDLHGPARVGAVLPQLVTHQQLTMAYLAEGVAVDDEVVSGYALSLLGSAAAMLRG